MWTRPRRPSSSWRNAPYGVMRCTVPSTTAPTSRSAISTPSSVGPSRPGQQGAHYPTRRDRASTELAGGRVRLASLRHGHEGDLPLLHHAQALPGQELQVLGVPEPVDPVLQPGPLLEQGIDLL